MFDRSGPDRSQPDWSGLDGSGPQEPVPHTRRGFKRTGRLRFGRSGGMGRKVLLAVPAAVCLLMAAHTAAPVPHAVAAERAAPGKAAKPSIVLSSDPERVETRPCMSEFVRVQLTNPSTQGAFADISITPKAPLWSANSRVSTYVPAGSTVAVPVQIYVPEQTSNGKYDLRLQVIRSTPSVAPEPSLAPRKGVTVPVTVTSQDDRSCIPPSGMTVTASSAQEPQDAPAKAIDGRTATIWHALYSPDRTYLPQWITFDLGGTYDVAELSYQPRVDGNLNGTITAYTVLASTDGKTFTEMTSGTWAADSTRKTAEFHASGARYIRLLATEGVSDYASAAEIVLFGQETTSGS